MSGANHAVTFEADKIAGYAALPQEFRVATDPGHFLYDPRVHLPADPTITQSMFEYGWIGGAIEVVVINGERWICKGRQRRSACEEANRLRVLKGLEPIKMPYMLRRKGATEQYSRETGLLENTARVNWGPASAARAAAGLQAEGYPPERIAFLAKIPSVDDIDTYLSVNECIPELRDAIERGEVLVADAPMLAKLPEADQRARLTASRSETTKTGKRDAIKGKAKKKPKRSKVVSPKALVHLAIQLPDGNREERTARYLVQALTGDDAPLKSYNAALHQTVMATWAAASRPGRKGSAK